MTRKQSLIYPIADHERLAVGRPGQGVCKSEAFTLIHAGFGPNVPDTRGTVLADAAQFGVLDRVEGHLGDGAGMALELGGKADK